MLSEAAASAEMGPWQTRVGVRTCSVLAPSEAALGGSNRQVSEHNSCSALPHRDQEKNLLQVCVLWLYGVKGWVTGWGGQPDTVQVSLVKCRAEKSFKFQEIPTKVTCLWDRNCAELQRAGEGLSPR